MKIIHTQNGFTLIEAVIAMAILAIGILTLQTMQVIGIKGTSQANRITVGSTWAADRIEQIQVLDYDDTILNDSDGDGTNQDGNEDGVDDDENNNGIVEANEQFGLEHDTVATADGNDTSPDNVFTIFWNVAVDQPVKNTKTIRIIVTSNQQGKARRVTFDYVKADII